MPKARAVLAATLLLFAAACSNSADRSPKSDAAVTEHASDNHGGHPVQIQRLPDLDRVVLPRLRTRLPRTVPADPERIPSLLADPPGRALIAYHPPESWDGASGWGSETILMYGADRQWRRLALEELDLPTSAWPGRDTYGPGSLSPDGRWWAGRSRAGVVLVDLGTAEHTVVDLGTDWVAEVRWRSNSGAMLVSHGLRGRTHEVTVPGLEISELPYRLWQVGVEPDGTVLALRRVRVGVAELVEHVDGQLVPRGRLEVPGLGRGLTRMRGVHATVGRFAVGHHPRPRGFRRVDLLVVGTDSLEVEAVLRYDNRDYTIRAHEWLDPATVLLDTDTGLLAWRPATGRLLRVVDIPAADPHEYWSVAIAGTTVEGDEVTDGSRG